MVVVVVAVAITSSTVTCNGGRVVTVVSMCATNWEMLGKSSNPSDSVGGVADHA